MKNISLSIAVSNHQSKIWIFAIILLSEFATPVLSQAQALGKKVKLQRLELSKKLSNSYAVGIAQDRYGYTWIGTEDGLNRFDGDSFKAYRSGGTSTIVHKITSGAAEWRRSQYWHCDNQNNTVTTTPRRIKSQTLIAVAHAECKS